MAAKCFRKCILIAGLAIATSSGPALPADSSFIFSATRTKPYTAAYLGNGFLGLETTPLAITPAHCFLAGVYDQSAGDVPRIASAPAWNSFDIYNGSHWLNGPRWFNAGASFPQIHDYNQTLDMYDGVLRTVFAWTEDGKTIRLRVESFVSRDRAETGATKLQITPDFSGPIQIRLPLRNWPAPHRYPLAQMAKLTGEAATHQWAIWYPGHLDLTGKPIAKIFPTNALQSLSMQAPHGPKVQETIVSEWSPQAVIKVRIEPQDNSVLLQVDARKGAVYNVVKFAALEASSNGPLGANDAATLATSIIKAGWDKLLSDSAAAWHKLWETDLLIQGDPELQRTIHSMLFYLLGSCREGLRFSTPPMGLSNAGYFGHIFWDADTFLLPPLLVLHPEMARPMVAFRSRTRETALTNARRNGYKGAMYPWEAGPDGAETTPRFASQNASSENHVNGDVAVAAWQYWLATSDREWLRNDAWPILRDTADFWTSRVTLNTKLNRYEIRGVVAVNESLIGVSNDAYTNAVAKINLELAAQAARELHLQSSPKWQEVASKMYLPPSDSPMLWYPLGMPFPPQQEHKMIQDISSRLQHHDTGAMMGTEFYPILAAKEGNRLLAGKLMELLSKPYLRPPFQVIAETPQNQNTNFITGAGAFLQEFVYGFTGLRLGTSGLERKFPPTLPAGISRLTLKNITVHGQRQTLVFNATSAVAGANSGAPK